MPDKMQHLMIPVEAIPSSRQRRAGGKAMRGACPRRSHAGWQPSDKRCDPVKLLKQTNEGRVPELIPIRFGRMMASPFTFYRGAAALMAADLAHTPITGIRVQACGDCHLMNFGGFATPERNILFDINDFDETLPAAWEWDVKRLAASFVAAADDIGCSRETAGEIAAYGVTSYREHMAQFAEMRFVDLWYEGIRWQELVDSIEQKPIQAKVQKKAEKASARKVFEDDFPKLARVDESRVRLKDDPPLLTHRYDLSDDVNEQIVLDAFHQYRKSLSHELEVLLNRYRIQDVATKVVGIGSVGTQCGVLLLMASEDDPLFLQIKEARPSVLEPYFGRSLYDNHGQRVVVGQRIMQAATDLFLGWTSVEGRHFYIRQLRDAKIKLAVASMNASLLRNYSHWCGKALAQAHAKSGDAARISGYLGRTTVFDEAIGSFALAYYDQSLQDYLAFLNAIRAGEIEASPE